MNAVVADIQTQLQLASPGRTIIQRACRAIAGVTAVGTLAELGAHAAHLLAPLLS